MQDQHKKLSANVALLEVEKDIQEHHNALRYNWKYNQ